MNRRTGLYLLILFMAAVVIMRIAAVLLANYPSIWDDAYMYVRYADNLLHEGALSWNPGGAPTYGITSLLYLSVVVPIRALLPQNVALAILASSLISGLAFIALLSFLLLRYVDASKTSKAVLLLAILWAVAITLDHQVERTSDGSWSYIILNNHLARHFLSGMDTMFVLSFLTLYIIAAKQYERSRTSLSIFILGLLGGLAFFARPDLLLFSFIIPVSLIIFAADRNMRRRSLYVLGTTIIVLGVVIALVSLYFSTPLPLGYFTKGQRIYGDAFVQAYKGTSLLQFIAFIVSNWYLFLMIGAAFILTLTRLQIPQKPVEIGLLVATALFILYYLLFVLQIMGFSQRFYYPTLPALIFMAAESAAFLIRQLPSDARTNFQSFTTALPKFYTALVGLFFVGTVIPLAPVARDMAIRLRHGELRFLNMTVIDNYQTYFRDHWFALDEVAAMPDELVLATTEVGLPAALNPGKEIVDLAGLNDPSFALTEFSAETLFVRYTPDILYMPHPDYASMIQEIRTNSTFQKQYEYFPPESLGETYQMGVALRLDSPYYDQLRAIIDRSAQRSDRANMP